MARPMISGKCGPLVAAVDQGTSSTRVLIFASKTAELITYHQTEIQQLYPREGWAEQDPKEIVCTVKTCIEKTVSNLRSLGIDPGDIKAVGVTNQRETTVVWDKHTGEPLYNAILWLDTRTVETVEDLASNTSGRNINFLRNQCGLPVSTYFSALKLRWLLDHAPSVREAMEEQRCLFGTVDSWLIWNLTGGLNGGIHMTDVTNASRTMLMNIGTLKWDPDLCRFFGISMHVLPEIRSSSEIYGTVSDGPFKDIPISGCLGDQSAALVGQMCFHMGQAKNTYGTGCFLLYNTGTQPVFSTHGLLTTVAYKWGPDGPAFYALEGSIAIAGAVVQWLRDKLGLIEKSSDIASLAASVESTHGTYFVPAFSGLYAPYWQPDARGVICGLTHYTTKAHISRAALEAVGFQTREILDAMNKDCGISLSQLQVDGGMCVNDLLMQILANLIGIPVVRPSMPETTALGVAMAAGSAKGVDVWRLNTADLTAVTTDKFYPLITQEVREFKYRKWKEAIKRSLHWNTVLHSKGMENGAEHWLLSSLPLGFFVFSSFGLVLLASVLESR